MIIYFATATSFEHNDILNNVPGAENRLLSYFYISDKTPEAVAHYVEKGNFMKGLKCGTRKRVRRMRRRKVISK